MYGSYQRVGVEGVKDKGMEDYMTLSGGHTIQYTDYISQKCALNTI